MKSGDYTDPRDSEYYRKAFSEIQDRLFEQLTFWQRPALVSKDKRLITEYKGQPYNKEEFDLVEGMWEHEHCEVCWFKIMPGHTYWKNSRMQLCDACYEALL
jgi:hypothetical protein